MTDEQVLVMPVRRFWQMERNINRISAERDMRGLSVANSAQSPEAAKDYRSHLLLELGDVVKAEERLDRSGIEKLRAMSGQRILGL